MSDIALLMMVKNEQTYACRSLESVKNFVNTIFILDTGSTDNTIQEIHDWCATNNKQLFLKKSEFIDFSASRNMLLEYAETCAREKFYLLLDANDVVRGDYTEWLKTFEENPSYEGLLVKIAWQVATDATTVYFGNRLIRAHCGWRYRGKVHEYLDHANPKLMACHCQTAHIFQNRLDDGGKSSARFQRDYDILLKEVIENPDKEREVFYLARTCDALGKRDEAIQYYKLRTEKNIFPEEVYWSFLGIAKNYMAKGHVAIALMNYLNAYNICQRAECLIDLAKFFMASKQFAVAHLYAKMACELEYPEQAILFVDRKIYDYERWHLLGIVSYYCGRAEDGKRGCLRALEVFPDSELDKRNLGFYTQT